MTASRRLPLLILVLVASGCMSRAARRAERLEGRYQLGSPGSGWQVVSPGGADHAFHNDALSATIYTDSNCGSRYEDAPLERLAESVVFGVADAEPVMREEGQLDGRASLTVRQRGRLDGVPVELGVVVVKKNDCVYDLVLIAPPDRRFEQAWDGFQDTVRGFRAGS